MKQLSIRIGSRKIFTVPLPKFLTIAMIGLALATNAGAFSLLGPRTDWMDVEKGYDPTFDIGGPMNIGEGYRWNIPVITYGFDRSFLDYFGSNGIVAVEQAIDILNQVPPASQIDLENYRMAVERVRQSANADSLIDLKTQALGLLLEQMGLADSTRFAFCIRDVFAPPESSTYYFYIIERNFDPFTAQPSHEVNGTLLSYSIAQFGVVPSPTNVFCVAVPFAVYPSAEWATAVTSLEELNVEGLFATGLTRDDVGGLKYLLSSSQVRTENLLPDVFLVDTNSGPLVQMADRPGIEKVTFLRHPVGTLNGDFRPFTNRWSDVYFDFDFPESQEVERVTAKPDILFSARDLPPREGWWRRTGTTNWVNNSAFNGNQGGAGPGVIQPPITISFNSAAPLYFNISPANTNAFADETTAEPTLIWGTFDATTNSLIVYPAAQAPFASTTVTLHLSLGGTSHDIEWPLVGHAYGRFLLQTAVYLTNWTTLTTLTNSGASFDYQFLATTNETMRFFRTISLP